MMEMDGEKSKEQLAFYKKVAEARRIDTSFALDTDEDLTEEEIKAIDAFWGKYSFAYPEIDYKSFKTFKNRFGKFDVRHCPGAIRTMYFRKHFINSSYSVSWQNKGMLPILFPGVKMPVTVVRRLNGIYYDENFNPISQIQAINILLKKAKSGQRMINKVSNVGGGKGIFFIEQDATADSIITQIRKMGNAAFVVQEFLEQSDFMKKFNPTSVNTLRVTSLLFEGKVHVLAALVRIGKTGNHVDNYSQGGSLLGIDVNTGVCNKWALTHEHERITTLPSGLVLNEEEIQIPNFEEVKKTVERLHYYIPYIGLISWDIALDQNNVPVLIENNFAGMIQIHEAVTGPLFGDLMEKLCDKYLLDRFYFEIKVGNWLCEEYHDHIVLCKYLGEGMPDEIPETIKGKPVTSCFLF